MHIKWDWQIIIHVCNVHHRHAERSCRFQVSPRNYYNKPVCDLCELLRDKFVNIYPQLKVTSKLLCNKHFNYQLDMVEGNDTGNLLL